jgi:hypothetical protein
MISGHSRIARGAVRAVIHRGCRRGCAMATVVMSAAADGNPFRLRFAIRGGAFRGDALFSAARRRHDREAEQHHVHAWITLHLETPYRANKRTVSGHTNAHDAKRAT